MPSLSRPQFQRVFRASRAYKEYKLYQNELDDSDDDEGPDNEDAWLFEDLSILLKLWAKKKEKEQLLALIFEVGTTDRASLRRLTRRRESPPSFSKTSSQYSTPRLLRSTRLPA